MYPGEGFAAAGDHDRSREFLINLYQTILPLAKFGTLVLQLLHNSGTLIFVIFAHCTVDLYVSEVSQRCVADQGICSCQAPEPSLVDRTRWHVLRFINC